VAGSIVRVGQAVQPVVNLLRDELLDSPLVFGDETELQVLKEPGRSAQAKSYIWAQMTDGCGKDGTGPPIRMFTYSPSRSTNTAMQLYAGIRQGAVLMTDGYEVYDTVAEAHQLVHLGCWTHCRRYFHEALQALPKDQRGPDQLAARFIALIGKLYHIESQARRDGVDANELGRRRRQDSVPVLNDIQTLLLANLHAVLPKSLLGQALHYLASQWNKLKRYVEDGRYSIDNNGQENAIRPFCVGRRNWLFADTVAGANASANLYSLLQTCQVNRIDGYRYLRALFIALPKAQTATTTLRCCPGASTSPKTERLLPTQRRGARAWFIDRIRSTRKRHASARYRKGRSTSWATRSGGCTRRRPARPAWACGRRRRASGNGGKAPCDDGDVDDVARDHAHGGQVEPHVARLGQLLPSGHGQSRIPGAGQLHRCAVAPVVADQVQAAAQTGRGLSTLDPLRPARARAPDLEGTQPHVGEGVKSCPRAGCGRSARPVR
jgi:hypothetical protein